MTGTGILQPAKLYHSMYSNTTPSYCTSDKDHAKAISMVHTVIKSNAAWQAQISRAPQQLQHQRCQWVVCGLQHTKAMNAHVRNH